MEPYHGGEPPVYRTCGPKSGSGPAFAAHLDASIPALHRVVAAGALNGLALPALSAGLAWFDLMRTARGTANMIQAQRDFFGAHGFASLDGGSRTHGPWGHFAKWSARASVLQGECVARVRRVILQPSGILLIISKLLLVW